MLGYPHLWQPHIYTYIIVYIYIYIYIHTYIILLEEAELRLSGKKRGHLPIIVSPCLGLAHSHFLNRVVILGRFPYHHLNRWVVSVRPLQFTQIYPIFLISRPRFVAASHILSSQQQAFRPMLHLRRCGTSSQTGHGWAAPSAWGGAIRYLLATWPWFVAVRSSHPVSSAHPHGKKSR